MSASAVSKAIFEIKATEDNTKISIPMLSVSGKNVQSAGSLAASALLKSSGGRFDELLVIFLCRLSKIQAKTL